MSTNKTTVHNCSNDFEDGLTLQEAIAEANRCLQCKKPLCRSGCPVNNAIPQFIAGIKQQDYTSGIISIHAHSYLPAICGRVCPQEKQCEAACVLGRTGKPVRIGKLERFLGDMEAAKSVVLPQQTLAPVAVIGSGPAGLSAALQLAQLGHPVSVFEGESEPGGVLLHGIPEYRLPKDIVRKEVAKIQQLGIKFRLGVIVGEDILLEDLFNEGFEAVFIGTGAGSPRELGIPGENLPGVLFATYLLQTVNLVNLGQLPAGEIPVKSGERVLVIGAGNVAMDAARTALRLGAEVAILHRRGEAEMSAREVESREAKEEGAEFKFYTAPLEIKGGEKVETVTCAPTKVSIGQDGRQRVEVVRDQAFDLPADKVIVAVGQRPFARIVSTSQGFKVGSNGVLVTDETGMTSREGVFAAGDVVHGPATVVMAMGEGRKVAKHMHEYLTRRSS